jgi:hypothetical protein
MRKKYIKKTLYFDIGTEVRFKKAAKKKGTSMSHIIRSIAVLPTFEAFIDQLSINK